MKGSGDVQQPPQRAQHVQKPRDGVIEGRLRTVFLECSVKHVRRWVGPDLALKGAGNCGMLWAGMRSECSLSKIPFATVLGRDGVFSGEGASDWKGTWVIELG